MFNYNPTVNDRSGEILGAYTASAANTRAAGMQNFGQSIGKGLEKIGDSVGDALNDVKANAIKYDTAAGMLDTYKQNAEALGLDMQMLQGIEQKYANKPNELIGALTVVGKIGENNLDIQKAEKTYAALSNVYAGRASATAAAKAAQPPKYDFNYATEFNKALYDNGITDLEQRKQKFNEAGVGHLWEKFINPPKQNMGFFGPVTQ